MDALFHIKSNEFNEELFNRIKSLLESKKNLEVTIAITDESSKGVLRNETKEEYFARLNKAIENLNKGKGVSFTPGEFDDFSKQLLNEP